MVDRFVDKEQAAAYAKFRMSCSEEAVKDTVKFLKDQYSSPLTTAVDVGCGTGQGTRMIAPYFEKVIGFDVSEAQLEQAKMFPDNPTNIKYITSIAEKLPLEDSSVQLVIACHALHWFDLDNFFTEVKRVLTDNGVFMVWSGSDFDLMTNDQEKLDKLKFLHKNFLHETLRPYWDNRSFLVTELFKSVTFPFKHVERKEYFQRSPITIRYQIGYLESTSPFQKMKEDNPCLLENLVQELIKSSEEILGDLDRKIILQVTSISILCRNSK